MGIEDDIKVSIVMPAYNEEANIEKTVRACHKALSLLDKKGEIIVTNDGSKDRTHEILRGLQKELPELRVVNHVKNLGYGAALRSAIGASQGEYIATMDSDGQFDIYELPLFFETHLNGTAVVTGFRIKKKDTLFRIFANKGLNGLISALFGVRFKDINCAFRLYRAEILKSISIESSGYQAPSEIMLKLANLGFRAREIAVSHFERKGGVSALKPLKTIAETSVFLVYLKLKTTLYKKGVINTL